MKAMDVLVKNIIKIIMNKFIMNRFMTDDFKPLATLFDLSGFVEAFVTLWTVENGTVYNTCNCSNFN